MWSEAVKPLGPIAYVLKARVTLLRDMGSALSPFNAFLTLQGIETLALRIERHSKNAEAVAKWLAKRPEVTKVIYPSLQSGKALERAQKYLPGGYGGLVGFELAAASGRGGGSSTRCNSSTTSPTSATRASWPSIRPPRPIRSFRLKTSSPPA